MTLALFLCGFLFSLLMSEQTTSNSNYKYGNLKGHSLQTQDLPPMASSSQLSTPTSSSETAKLDLMTFCSKKRIQPDFRKQSTIQGFYKVLVLLNIPLVASDEFKSFEASGTGSKKKEAEDEASSALLAKLHAFYADYNPPDISDAKQQLIRYVQSHSRFGNASYEPDSIVGASLFRCKVEVIDSLICGKVYSTVGQAIGKKDAEKDGAYRMLKLLEGVLSIDSPSENKVELLEMTFGSEFPDYRLQYLPSKPDDGSELLFHICRLLVLKEDQPFLTIAISTGVDEETAKQNCAEIFLLHHVTIRKKLQVESI